MKIIYLTYRRQTAGALNEFTYLSSGSLDALRTANDAP